MRAGSRRGVKRPLVYLLDEDLASRSIVARLHDAGLDVRTIPDEFGRGLPTCPGCRRQARAATSC